jgi:hypothetical protein
LTSLCRLRFLCVFADPLPLRKAKITQGAALKKSEKAAKAAAQAAEAAAIAQMEAEAALAEAEVAEMAAAEAVAAAEGAFAAAEGELQVIMSSGDGVSHGRLWWMQRELDERKKFMPRSKQ